MARTGLVSTESDAQDGAGSASTGARRSDSYTRCAAHGTQRTLKRPRKRVKCASGSCSVSSSSGIGDARDGTSRGASEPDFAASNNALAAVVACYSCIDGYAIARQERAAQRAAGLIVDGVQYGEVKPSSFAQVLAWLALGGWGLDPGTPRHRRPTGTSRPAGRAGPPGPAGSRGSCRAPGQPRHRLVHRQWRTHNRARICSG